MSEEEIRMEGRYEDLFKHIRDAILVADTERRIINCNPAFSDLFGYSLADIEGQPTEILYAESAEFESMGAEIQQHIDDIEFTYTVQYLTKQGAVFWGETNVFYHRDVDGEPTAFVGVIRDITERQWREKKNVLIGRVSQNIARAESFDEGLEHTLRDITAYSEWQYAEAWVPTDEATMEFAVGHAASGELEAFHVASKDVTFPFGEGLPGRVYEGQTMEWIPNVATATSERFHRRDLAAEHGVRAALGIPLMHGSEVLAVLTFFLTKERPRDEQLIDDISQVVEALGGLIARKLAADQIKVERDRLEAFANLVSHDLRNPLSVAQGRLELALEEEGDNDDLRAVQQSLDRMDVLIDDLLTLARSGGDIGDSEPVNIAEVAESCWDEFVMDDATLTVTSSGTIMADASRFRQLLENLLGNALEHGGNAVSVSIEDLPDGFAVEDNGPGIDTADIEEIFEAGYTSAPEGTGFGLAIVKEIVDAHGWSISVGRSEAGGARFEITDVDVTSSPGS